MELHKVIHSYIQGLVEAGHIDSQVDIHQQFELLSNFLLITKGKNDLDLNDFLCPTGTEGIDSIAIKINGEIYSFDQCKIMTKSDFPTESRVEIIFIQSKTSSSFDKKTIQDIILTIKQWLKDKKLDFLVSKAEKFLNFECSIYYVTTGNDPNSTQLESRKKEMVNLLNEESIFDKINYELIGVNEIKQLYRKVSQSSEIKFSLANPITIDQIDNEEVYEAFLGIIDYENLKKILEDESSNPFYDNVRSFLGTTTRVNNLMHQTAQQEPQLFVLLNNGITLLSDRPVSTRTGNQFTIKNFQIVNGCQTCNVLKEIDGNTSKLNVPIKVVYTESESIKSKIIWSTNSQTGLGQEQLQAITSFQKSLQEYFPTQQPVIYYERRTNEFKGKYKKHELINIREQIKVMVGVFLAMPHLPAGYFAKAYSASEGKIFLEEHREEIYYLGALLRKLFLTLIGKDTSLKKYNIARYHIFLLVRLLFEKEKNMELPNEWNGEKIVSYTTTLKKFILGNTETVFGDAIKELDVHLEPGKITDEDGINTLYKKEFTDKLLGQ